MWTIRTSLVKFTCRQQTPSHIIVCQRGFTTAITDKGLANSSNNETDSGVTTIKDANTPSPKKPKEKKRHSRRLLNKLQKRVKEHGKKQLATQTPAIYEPVLLEEMKQDLDSTWDSLNSDTQYERIYPQTIIPVATLAHGLEQTLFKTGVHPIKDFQTQKRLFSKYLETITQPDDFNYEAVQPYITSSKDKNLIEMAANQKARYVGSTSSLSGILSHFYFKLSNHRPVDTSVLSPPFAGQTNNYTRGSRVPKSILLRWKNGVYAVDADKAFDTGETILSQLGKSMEKFLTLEPSDYERYLKENIGAVTEEERNAPEAFAYGKIEKLFLRSQLDCYHSRLPRRTFDLKTRAIMPIRLDIPHYKDYYDYKLTRHRGMLYSFEREYYDMMRSAFLKYSFQVRIGHMDGVMVTYHNTDEIFGFQYISRKEMDSRLFGTSKMGDEAFKYCLTMMQTVFDKATSQHPQQTLRLTFDASRATYQDMRIYVEPVSPEEEKRMDEGLDEDEYTTGNGETTDFDYYQALGGDRATMYHLYTNSYLNDKKIQGPVSVNAESDKWDVYYKLEEETSIPKDDIRKRIESIRTTQATIFLPQSDESPPFLLKFKKKPDQQQDGDTYLQLARQIKESCGNPYQEGDTLPPFLVAFMEKRKENGMNLDQDNDFIQSLLSKTGHREEPNQYVDELVSSLRKFMEERREKSGEKK